MVLVYRGCHELEVTNSPITYSAAYTGDAHTALQEIQKRYPNEQVRFNFFSSSFLRYFSALPWSVGGAVGLPRRENLEILKIL